MVLSNTQIDSIIHKLHQLEDSVVVALLMSVIVLALIQIILRNVFDEGIVWAESLLRVQVLWLGLFGGILAARKSKQLNIDVLSKYMSVNMKAYSAFFNNIFAAMICIIISYFSMVFLQLEYEASSVAFEKVPFWITASVIPFSFLIMSIKYALKSYIELKQLNK